MAQAVADVYATNIQVIDPTLPELFEKNPTTYGLLTKAGKTHKISKTVEGKDFRAPIQIAPGGIFGALNLAGGSFGAGSGDVFDQMYQTYFAMKLGAEQNLDTIMTTETSGQSIINAFRRQMKSLLANMQWYANASLHNITGNQGLIAYATALDTATLTMDNVNGANLLQQRQRVEIFDTTLGDHKTAAVSTNLPYISAMNKATRTVTLTNLGAVSLAATDKLAFPGVTGTPTWLQGLNYFHTADTSGTLLGITKSSVPEILPTAYAAGEALVPMHGLLVRARVMQRRGKVGNLTGIIHPCQAAQIYQLGMAISEWQRGRSDKMIDIAPAAEDNIPFAGISHRLDIHQDKTRIDWIDPKMWLRVYLQELGFYKEPGTGRTVFTVYSSNYPSAAICFYMMLVENFVCLDPGSEAMITGLTVPTNF